MLPVTGQLLRRGLEARDAYRGFAENVEKHQTVQDQLTPFMIATFVFTGIFFVVLLVAAEYTYGHLIPTLAMVESPSTLLVETVTTQEKEGEKEPFLEEHEAVIVHEKPITSSTYKTILHLRSVGGYASRFRGWTMYSLYLFFVVHFSHIFAVVVPFSVGVVAASVLFVAFRVGWVQVIVSSPSPLPWYRRLPSFNVLRKVAGPTALLALVEELTMLVPLSILGAFELDRFDGPSERANGPDDSEDMSAMCAVQFVAVALVSIAWAVGVLVPMKAAVARIYASHLDKAEETIISVERTEDFGLAKAWKSVDWSVRKRVCFAYAKCMLIQWAIAALCFICIFAEVVLFFGPNYFDAYFAAMAETNENN